MAIAEPARGVKEFVILTLAFHKEGKWWLGECRELGTASYGKTLEQASDELIEFVELHLSTLEETGEREYFFDEHGIKCHAEPLPLQVNQPLAVGDESLVRVRSFPLPGVG